MLFLSLYTASTAPSGPPDVAHMTEMNDLMEKMTKAGILIFAGGLAPSEQGWKLKQHNGAYTTTDGPFTYVFAKGMGFALMQAESREALMPHMKEFLSVAGDGECEIMPVFGGPPPA